jgi:hypothetical protein
VRTLSLTADAGNHVTVDEISVRPGVDAATTNDAKRVLVVLLDLLRREERV